ncbi:hypothetical protein H4R34_006035, partial [Dimargaris verticillata]
MLGQLMACVAHVLAISYGVVDPARSFFSVGGDSISAIQLMMQCTKRGWPVAVPDVFNATSIAELAQAIESRQPACAVEATGASSPIPLSRTEQWYLNAYDQCPQGLWASAVTLLPKATALEALKHWIVDLMHAHEPFNRQLNTAQGAWQPRPPLTVDTLDSTVMVQLVQGYATLEQVLAHVEQGRQALANDHSPLICLSLYALKHGTTLLAITAQQLLIGPHAWPAVLRSLGQTFDSSPAITQPDPLHTPTLSHPSTLHPTCLHQTPPLTAVQPLVDYAAMHAQPQYLDAVVLGCFAYAYHSLFTGVHLAVLHEANQGVQPGPDDNRTAQSGLLMATNSTLSLAHTIDLAKQVVYGQSPFHTSSNDASPTEPHSDTSVLYHA